MAEAAARLPSVLMASGPRAARKSAAMRWLQGQLTWRGLESLRRISEDAFARHLCVSFKLECRSDALQVCLHFGVNVNGRSACSLAYFREVL
jgi:hypothetical protein